MHFNNVLCQQAWEILENDSSTMLVDVRTEFEWQNVGKPQLTNMDQLLLNSIKIYPLMNFNPDFIETLLRAAVGKTKVFFICRYGSRSQEAAILAFQNGIDECYSLIDGFEGNEYGPGWVKSNLPFII